MIQLDKIPNSPEAEQQIIGALLVEPDLFATVIDDIIQTEHFWLMEHRIIFKAIADLINAGEAVDFAIVHNALESSGNLEKAGGGSYLSDCLAVTTSTANIEHHCQIVIKTAQQRELINLAQWLSAQAQSADIGETVDKALLRLHDIGQYGAVKTNLKPLSAIIPGIMETVEAHQRGEIVEVGVPTGYSSLDYDLGSFQPGQFIVIAARPGMGKTGLALNLARNIGNTGKRVLFLSVEMTERELGLRLLTIEAEVDLSPLKRRKEFLSNEMMRKLATALGKLNNTPIWIDDNPDVGLSNIRSQLHRMRIQNTPADIVVIDYLQIMRMGVQENQNQRVAAISRGMKVLAKSFNIPVVALSQLSRKNEERTNKTPLLADLRDSGAIEQDADVVMFIHRPEEYDDVRHDIKNLAEVIVAKNRGGKTGIQNFTYLRHTQRFEMRSDTAEPNDAGF